MSSKFEKFLWPATKNGKIGFYDKYETDTQNGSVSEGDFTRANSIESSTQSGRVVINESGNFVELDANDPGWTFPLGGSASGTPYLSFLPSAKNLIESSNDLTVNSWTKQTNATVDGGVADSVFGGTSNRINFSVDSISRVENATTIENGKSYVIGFWVKSESGNLSFNFLFGGNLPGTYEVSVTEDWQFVSFSSTSTGTIAYPQFRNSSSGGVKSILVSNVMMKEGTSTSPNDYVPTSGVSLTRQFDDFSFDFSSTITTPKKGSVMFQVGGNNQARNDAFRMFTIGDSTSSVDNGLEIIPLVSSGSGVINIWSGTQIGTGGSISTDFSLDKYIFGWDSSGWYVYKNGIILISGSEQITLDRANLYIRSSGKPIFCKSISLNGNKISNSQAIESTSWPDLITMAQDLNYT